MEQVPSDKPATSSYQNSCRRDHRLFNSATGATRSLPDLEEIARYGNQRPKRARAKLAAPNDWPYLAQGGQICAETSNLVSLKENPMPYRYGPAAALAAMLLLTCGSIAAETDGNPLAGAATLRYACKPGTQCPTDCAWGDKVLFTTGNFKTISIFHLPQATTLIRVDTGDQKIDYVTRSNEIMCRIAGASMSSAEPNGNTPIAAK
jgi:hypothetical protein